MKFKAVVFDWAGTMIDFGSFAPMGAFVDVFAEFGMDITVDQARAPMGMAKRDHIAEILKFPDVKASHKATYGHQPGEPDIDRIYDVFVPLNEKVVAKYADLVPGTLEMLAWLHEHNIRVGSTTGYTRSIMNQVIPIADANGYKPECIVCSDEVENGRPAEDAMRKCFELLDVSDPKTVIKVDDTVPGIGEGVSAGCLTVGVALSGNYVGLTPEEIKALAPTALQELRSAASEKLIEAGADHVIDTVADLPALIAKLDKSS